MNYKELNDYELVYQVRENNSLAYDTIVSKYSHVVEMMAKKMLTKNRNIGLDYEDLYQEGMYGIVSALNDYNSSSTMFYTYACLCAKREMERIVKTYKRKKHTVLNEAFSIEKNVSGMTDVSLGDLISSDYSLEDDYDIKCSCNKLFNFKYELCFIDSLVYELKLNNFSISEIALLLDITYKNVDYRLHRIRKKLINFV